MANSLFPAYVQIHYASQFAPHVATIPTRAWIDPAAPLDNGSYFNWNEVEVDATDMITEMAQAMADNFNPVSSINAAHIYTLETPTSPPLLRRIIPLNVVGTSALVSQQKAMQHTYIQSDTNGGLGKLVLLDAPLPADFNPDNILADLNADQQTLVNTWTAAQNAWSTRKGNQPIVFRGASYKLNDALRRAYHMD